MFINVNDIKRKCELFSFKSVDPVEKVITGTVLTFRVCRQFDWAKIGLG